MLDIGIMYIQHIIFKFILKLLETLKDFTTMEDLLLFCFNEKLKPLFLITHEFNVECFKYLLSSF